MMSDLGNPQLMLYLGKWRLSDMLSVRYDTFSCLFHNIIDSYRVIKENAAVLWYGFQDLYPYPQKTETGTSHSINTILSSYLLNHRGTVAPKVLRWLTPFLPCDVPVGYFYPVGKAGCFVHYRIRQYLKLLYTTPYLGALRCFEWYLSAGLRIF